MFALVAGAERPARRIDRDEAQTAFDDERVMTAGDDLSEAHPPNRVEREPRLHPDVDGHAVEHDDVAEGPAGGFHQHGRLADESRRRGVLVGAEREPCGRRSEAAVFPPGRLRPA